MKFTVTHFLCFLSFGAFSQITISKSQDEGMEAFKIETKSATYYYQVEAGGFSSIVDQYGNDWVNFTTEPKGTFPSSASSDYRGLPNLVHGGEQSGLGHPGFSKCTSTILNKNTILSSSNDGNWQWEWSFFEDHAKMTLIKSDPTRKYWFLYEGTIGGTFDLSQNLWGTDVDGLRNDQPDFIKTEGTFENWQTVFFGNKGGNNTFFISQDEPDQLADVFGYMGNTLDGNNSPNGMVVFGFGRGKGTKPMFQEKHNFTIGFVPKPITKKNIRKKINQTIK